MSFSFDEFVIELDLASKRVAKKAEEALNMIAEDLLAESQKHAPFDQGDLMGSGSVDPAKLDGDKLIAKVGYSSEYALRRHEDIYNLGEASLEKEKATGVKVGRKYLSRPLQQNSEKYSNLLLEKTKEVFD
jgi:hypothetical protein